MTPEFRLHSLSAWVCQNLKLAIFNASRFHDKSHQILYLSKERTIAIAVEKCSGGAVLLDKDLTHLRHLHLSKEEKQQFLASVHAEQEAMIKDPERLRRVIRGIGRTEFLKIYKWDKKRKKYKRKYIE